MAANRGDALHFLHRLEAFPAIHDKTLAPKPHLTEAFNNRSTTLRDMMSFDDAVRNYASAEISQISTVQFAKRRRAIPTALVCAF